MIKRLPLNDQYKYVLKLNISDISSSSIIMNIAINQTNTKLFTGERSFLVFGGEQIVEAKLIDNKKWIYLKTLKYKGHITD